MTARVTTLKGPSAGAYYVEQLPAYYLDTDEPRGTWIGQGAAALGLSGVVGDTEFLAVIAGMHPDRPDRALGRGFDDRSVRGYDVTCSAPKSVSVLWALGNDHIRQEVTAAHDAAVEAVADWIESHAHTRYRIDGDIAVVDAAGIVAAAFRQHTSRALDPQLHTHLVIANRVQAADGRWLALDARTIKVDQRTLSALYHAGLRAELTDRLGVRWHPVERGIAELTDVPEIVRVEFSRRTTDVQRRLEVKLDRFIDSLGRDPTPRERWQLEREAVLDSRPRKPKGTDAVTLHEQWRQQAVALGVDPGRLMRAVVGRTRGVRLDRPAMWGVCEEAVLVISEKQSTWRPAELVRELAAVVPTVIGTNAAAIMAWLEQTARELVVSSCVDLSRPIPPGSHLRFDGRPVTESVLDRALTTQAILDQEAAVIGWAGHRLDHQADNEPGVITRDDGVITAAQAEVAAATAGWADLILVVGPAGTGKTTALAPAVEQLRRDGRAVFGVAPSAAAAQVLASETGVEADTIDKLLIEHHLTRPPDHRYQLPVGATIIVDEAGMLPTPTLASLADLADARGWRVVLIGDPMQFTAVGRGGLFTLLTDTYGAIELDRVHRFTHSWERDASLRLRRGDVEVADLYDQHGRLHGGTPEQTERAAVRAWAGHRHHGARVLLMAPDNQTVDRLNQRAQQHRLDTNELDPTGRTVTTGSGMQLHAGDEIATRQNQRDLTTDQGDMVRNRACWTITAIHPDDSLTATGTHGTIRLPAAYVHDHVELAYATTGHGAQGRTVDHALLVLTSPTDIRNLYVPLTRGTHSNHAYITTIGEQTAHDVFAQSMTTDWIDQPAHTRQTELQHPGQHPGHHPGLLNPHHQRQLHDQQHELSDTLTTAVRDSNAISAELQLGLTERDTTRTRHDHLQTQVANAQHVIDTYDRPLRRARHHDEIAAARHTLATVPNQIEQASARLNELDNNIDQLETTLADTQHARTKQPDIEHQLDNIGDTLDQNRDLHTRITPRHPTDGPRMPSPAPTPNQQLRQQLQQLMPPTIEIDTPDIDL